MIIRIKAENYILITQHNHALLAGKMAAHWGNSSIPALPDPSTGLLTAIRMHDRGWVKLDANPLWNESTNSPHSFLDEPLPRRIPAYRNGITMVEEIDPYAGLLCSLHYSSFFPPSVTSELGREVEAFVDQETSRQIAIIQGLDHNGRQEEIARKDFDLGILKLLDNFSLYICLNSPGVSKENEHPWYREGFKPTRLSSTTSSQDSEVQFEANWLDKSTISIIPFPFKRALNCQIPFKRLLNTAIKRNGYAQTFKKSSV